MAECLKIEPRVVPPPPTYGLELTEVEAEMLRRLLYSHISIHDAGPLLSIQRALAGAGVAAAKGTFRSCVDDTLRYIPA